MTYSFPQKVDNSFFDGSDNSVFAPFYEPIIETDLDVWGPVDFDIRILRFNAEPVAVTLPVTFDIPGVFEAHPEIHHLLPCRIAPGDLLRLIRERIEKEIERDENFELKVGSHFLFLLRGEHKREVISLSLHDWIDGAVQVPAISAENYSLLERRVNSILDCVSEVILESRKSRKCTKCDGKGYQTKKSVDIFALAV